MTNSPSVAIGMPIYNATRHLSHAIESVLEQDFEDWELFISDNASTDETWMVCSQYAQKDGRIRLHRNRLNIGMVENFELVIRETSAPYFMWMAHDDILEPNYVGACYDFLKARSDYVVCYSPNNTIDQKGNVFKYFDPIEGEVDADDMIERFSQCISKLYPPMAIYGMIRRDALVKTRRFSSSVAPHGQDYVRLLELSLYGKFHQLPEILRSYRIKTDRRPGDDTPYNTVVQQAHSGMGRSQVPVVPAIRCAIRMLSISIVAPCNTTESLKIASLVIRDKIFLSLFYRDAIVLQKLVTYRFPALHEFLGRGNRKFLEWVVKRFNVPMRIDPTLL